MKYGKRSYNVDTSITTREEMVLGVKHMREVV